MVGRLIRLRWRLQINQIKRSTPVLVISILGALYILANLAVFLIALGAGAALGEFEMEQRNLITTIVGTLIFAAWVITPLFLSSGTKGFELRNFAPFGIKKSQLMAGFFFSTLLSWPGILSLLVGLSLPMTWLDQPGYFLLSLACSVVLTACGIIIHLLLVSVLTPIFSRRGVRETIQIVLAVLMVAGGFLYIGALENFDQLMASLDGFSTWLVATPVGIVFVPSYVATGQWGLIGAVIAVVLIFFALVWWGYSISVARAEDRAAQGSESSGSAQRRDAGRMGKATDVTSAIRARALSSWRHDPRYSMTFFMVPALLVAEFFVDGGWIYPAMTGIIGILFGVAISADLGYDGSAFHMHVTSGVSGLADRWGRVSALLVWSVPLMVALAVLQTWMSGRWSMLPTLLGVALASLLISTGISAVVSARFIYPVPPSGASLFYTPPGGMGTQLVVQSLMGLANLVILLPVIGISVTAWITDQPTWAWATAVGGIAYGAGICWAGVRLGARWYDRDQDKSYQSVLRLIPEG